MKQLKLSLLSIFLLTFSLGFFSPKTAFADSFTLMGSVKNSSGTAIAGATVNVNDANSDNTTTDNSGNYNFPSIPGGTYNIQVTPPGSNFSPAIALSQNISGNTSLNFILVNAGSVLLSGHLYDPLDNPVSGQSVSLQLPSGSQIAGATTDASGSYSFQVSSGTYHLFVFNGNTLGNYPWHYQLFLPDTAYTQSTIQNITIPAKKVSIHVQDGAGTAVGNVILSTGTNLVSEDNLSIGGGITISAPDGYTDNTLRTDQSGNATMWLFPGTNPYTIIATPPGGSIYKTFTLSNVIITGDQTELISLQYNHATPTTTATLSPVQNLNGTYTDPVTVTLSATAASGYTVAYTYYTVDGGAQQTYSSPFNVTGSGSHTITYWSVDNSGVIESAHTKTFIEVSSPMITYYTSNNGSSFSRSSTPYASGLTTQTVNSDGSVTISVNNAPGYADSGIVLYEGTLGNLPDFTVNGTGDHFGLNLWFDINNNNEYFAWDENNVLTSLDGDTYGLSTGSTNGVLTVNDTTQFFMMSDGQNHSLSDLKNGTVSGITANTKVSIWIGVNTTSSGGSISSTITSISGL